MHRLPNVVPLQVPVAKLSVLDPLALSWYLRNKHDGIFLSPGFNAPLCSPIPQVLTLHDLIHLEAPEKSGPLIQVYYKTIVKPAVRRAWRVLTVSDISRRKIADWSGIDLERIHVVGNGISAAFQPIGPRLLNTPPAYFLHVGRRASHKNIERLIQAFSFFRKRNDTDVRLLFTLEPDKLTLEAAAKHSVVNEIDFLGNLSDEALAACYRGAIALVYPSLAEGFGLPIVEAMACGTPVLTSNLPFARDIVGENGALLIQPDDEAAIANGMLRLSSEPDLRNAFSNRGLLKASEYNWDTVAERIRNLVSIT